VVGVRFSNLSPQENEQLEALLRILLHRRGDGEDDPHLSKRVELMFDDPAELRATLDAVAQGSLAVTLVEQLEQNESLQVLIGDMDGVPIVNLRGRVARQTRLGMPGAALYRLSMVFEHSKKELKGHVQRALGQAVTETAD
jgi:hypothetical protein